MTRLELLFSRDPELDSVFATVQDGDFQICFRYRFEDSAAVLNVVLCPTRDQVTQFSKLLGLYPQEGGVHYFTKQAWGDLRVAMMNV